MAELREILFRGKSIKHNLWVEGAFSMKDCDSPFGEMVYNPSIIKYEEPCSGFWFPVYPETVGQYTGLTDENGKKIFEGDIIEWDELEWGSKHREVVTWDYNLFAIRKDDWGEWCEVIGNIHDNPELIGGKGNA